MTKITPEQALDLLWQQKVEHTIFTVCFVRRTDAKDGSAKAGDLRVMRAVPNYKALLKGGAAAYDAIAKRLLVVRDLEKGAIRSIPVDSVVWIKCNGETFEVEK